MQSRLEQDIISTAESFINNFSDKGNFDFSVQSLRKVDDILEELCEFEIDKDSLDSVSSMVGSYIFEVARRNYGGKYYWMQDREQPVLVTGEPEFSISIFAFDKVRGRIQNGKKMRYHITLMVILMQLKKVRKQVTVQQLFKV